MTVKDGSKTLVSGTDYTVSYANNTDVGTATVTVTGMSNYTGIIEKTFDIILTDADQVEAAKKVVEKTLADYTATNSTTTQEIQDKIDEALRNAGISDMTVTVGDITKREATTSEAGSISGSVSIAKGNESDSVAISKMIAQLLNLPVIVPIGGIFQTESGKDLILPNGGTIDEDGNVEADKIISGDTTVTAPAGGKVIVDPDGNIIVPAGGTVQTGDEEPVTLPNGGNVNKDGNVSANPTTTPTPSTETPPTPSTETPTPSPTETPTPSPTGTPTPHRRKHRCPHRHKHRRPRRQKHRRPHRQEHRCPH